MLPLQDKSNSSFFNSIREKIVTIKKFRLQKDFAAISQHINDLMQEMDKHSDKDLSEQAQIQFKAYYKKLEEWKESNELNIFLSQNENRNQSNAQNIHAKRKNRLLFLGQKQKQVEDFSQDLKKNQVDELRATIKVLLTFGIDKIRYKHNEQKKETNQYINTFRDLLISFLQTELDPFIDKINEHTPEFIQVKIEELSDILAHSKLKLLPGANHVLTHLSEIKPILQQIIKIKIEEKQDVIYLP